MATLKTKVKRQMDSLFEKAIKRRRDKLVQNKGHYKTLASTGVKDSSTGDSGE